MDGSETGTFPDLLRVTGSPVRARLTHRLHCWGACRREAGCTPGWVRLPQVQLPTGVSHITGGLLPHIHSPGLNARSEDCPQRGEGDIDRPRATRTGTWAGGAGSWSGDRSLALICLQLCKLGRGPAVLSTIKFKNKMRWNMKSIKLK